MDKIEIKEENQKACQKRNLPKSIIINGNELNYKEPPLKDNKFKYRYHKKGCKYFVKINQENVDIL